MLQGTFETLGLAELLGILAHTRKTGALWLDAGPASAVIYVVDGRCCAAISNESTDPLSDAPALLMRLVDLCFSVARSEDGSFRFSVEESPWTCEDTVDLDVVNDEVGRLLDEWREIQAVIPSLECRLKLTDELGVDELPVDRERWRLLTAIDGRRSVRELVRKTNRPVLEVCHAVLALVDAGACTVGQPPAAPSSGRSTGGKASRAIVDPETPWGPGVESPHPGPGAVAVSDDGEPIAAGKGQYLRVFSTIREA